MSKQKNNTALNPLKYIDQSGNTYDLDNQDLKSNTTSQN